ncbi:MAG: 7TM-DISM domain-containing protein, partial [Pseudomonas sp.]
MRRLRIAIGLTVSLLLTLLYPLSVPAAENGGWSALLDTEASLQLDDIRSPRYLPQFSPIELDQLYAPGGHNALWLHYRLPPAEQERLLRVFAPYLGFLDLYVVRGDELLAHTRTGSRLPFASRPLPSRDFLLPLPQAKEPLELFLRLASEHALRPTVSLESAAAMAADQNRPLLYGLLLGGFAMLALYNLVRFAYARAPISLWLAAAQLCLLATALSLLGISTPWLGDWQTAQPQIANLSMLLAMLCTLAFTASFFRKVCPSTPLTKLLLGEIALIALTCLVLLIATDLQFNQLVYLLAAVAGLSSLLVAAYHWQHGYRPARLFSLALLLFCLAFGGALPALFGYWSVQS